MKMFFEPKIDSPKDLLDYFLGLVRKGGDPNPVPMETCIAAIRVLEKEVRKRSQAEDMIRNLEMERVQTAEQYKQMLNFFMDILPEKASGGEEQSLSQLALPVKQLRKALARETADPVLVERSFLRLKDAVLTETRGNTRKIDRVKLLGLMGKWLKLPGKKQDSEAQFLSFFILCKESYLGVVHQLKQALGRTCEKKTIRIEHQIHNAQSLDEFRHIKNCITGLLQDYMAEAENDRAQAVCFAEGISKRLMQMDKKLVAYYNCFQTLQEENLRFNQEMTANVNGLKDSLSIGASIQELTRLIDRKITLISSAVNRKREKEVKAEQHLRKQMDALRGSMEKIREELVDVKQENKSLRKELATDHLTGAASRRAFESRAGSEMQRFMRYGRAFSMMIFDVDRFKQINDHWGHTVGDKCLKELVAKVKPVLRETDILARTGGDEFVVIMPETCMEDAKKAGEKIRNLVNRTEFIYKSKRLCLSLSIGLTQAQEADRDYKSVFDRADQGLYLAKSHGRNQVRATA